MLVNCSISKGCADLAYVYQPPIRVHDAACTIGADSAICYDVGQRLRRDRRQASPS